MKNRTAGKQISNRNDVGKEAIICHFLIEKNFVKVDIS